MGLGNSPRQGPALSKFCIQEERKWPKAMNLEQAEKAPKQPIVARMNEEKGTKGKGDQSGNILKRS